MHPGGFLAGLLLGGLAGAGTMLLLAPHSGRRTRANIQRKTIELRDQANETVEGAVAQARSKAYHITNSVQRNADHMQKRGQEILDDQVKHVNDAVETGKMAIRGS